LSRFKRPAVVTAGFLGLLTAVSLAFFVGSFLADGTHTGTAGSGGTGTKTLSVEVNFPDGELTPTKSVPLTAEVNNTTSKVATFHHLSFAVTTGAAGCNASWFKVVPVATGSPEAAEVPWWQEVLAGTRTATLNYQPGKSPAVNNANAGLRLEMTETGTDQSACEGAPVTVAAHLS
jgi:hypothetical protein